MTVFIQNDATGAGVGNVDANQAFIDLFIISNSDTGLGLVGPVGNIDQVTYGRTDPGAPAVRLNALINTVYNPNYGGGAQTVNIFIIGSQSNFILNDGRFVTNIAGTALPPQGSGLAGAGLNTTNNCLVIYDTSQSNGNGYCVARNGTGGTYDLAFSSPAILYHELSHAFRIVNNNLQALTAACNPSSPEENAAILDENVYRTQSAASTGVPVVLRDPGIHCGIPGSSGSCKACCIIASVASRSPFSAEVQLLRAVRDQFLRATEVGFAFFQNFFRDYYAFSPQVSTIMAGQPQLSDFVLQGYVRPLIISLQLLQEENALEAASDKELGEAFIGRHPDHAAATETLALLKEVDSLLQGDMAHNELIPEELIRLLQEHAWKSEHIQWALIEPVRIYANALDAYVAGHGASRIGKILRQAYTVWGYEMPIDDIWASLSVKELEEELAIYESLFLRTAEARSNFRKRLASRFNDITAVQSVLGRLRANSGEL